MPGIDTLVSLSGIFTVLFVMLGPLKVIGPFAALRKVSSRRRNDASRY